MEAVILAGGMGSRLRSVVSDMPKPMAPINGKPFLCYLFEYLHRNRVNKVVLSVGYRYDKIVEYFGDKFKDISITYSIEDEPLGTGGAIKRAINLLEGNNVIILNGDTLFDVELDLLIKKHIFSLADITLALKPMKEYNRYGSVITDDDRIICFEEKKYTESGNINGGVYIAKSSVFSNVHLPDKFSFEKDFLEVYVDQLNMKAFISDGYFIDIGIPDDYLKAGRELPKLYE